MYLADFNPSILFLLLWGLLSWLTKKKKKEAQDNQPGENPQVESKKEDIFQRLRKLQDHLASEVDIFPSEPDDDKEEEKYVEFEPEAPVTEIEPESEYPFPEEKLTDLEVVPVQTSKAQGESSWIKQVVRNKDELKKAIILKEILDTPRALRPF